MTNKVEEIVIFESRKTHRARSIMDMWGFLDFDWRCKLHEQTTPQLLSRFDWNVDKPWLLCHTACSLDGDGFQAGFRPLWGK